jgi:MerR family transcriptional regulator, light-induced transcriptional regulator
MPAEVSDTPLYNTSAVVQRTGVPATTIRAWERRYGYPKPHRDTGGQRLYSEHDIQAIRWLSDQTTRGLAISRAVDMLRGGHAGPDTVAVPLASRGGRSFEAVRVELGQALLGLDADRGELILSEAFALFSVEDVCLHVLQPLLVEVGDRWHAGELSVAEEHYVSSFVRTKLFSLLEVYQGPDRRGPLVFTACAPDEWHELGILIVSIFLARRGYVVRYLGPNLPLEGLAAVVARHHPAVVALSAQTRETARKLRGAAQALQQGAPPHPGLVFGGQAFNADARLRGLVDGTYVGPDAEATVEAIIGLVDQRADRHPRASRSVRGRRG